MNCYSDLLQATAFSRPGGASYGPELPQDEALPQLGTVRDVSMMRSVLQRALFGGVERYRIEDCAITHIRYRPGEGCSIAYRLNIRDQVTRDTVVQRLFARVVPSGLSQELFIEASSRARVATPFGDPVLHLPDLGSVIWVFPNDPKLDGLPALVDESLLADSFLPHLAAEDCGPDWSVSNWHTEVVSYVPEHRCTLRAVVQLRHKTTGEFRARTYYGKAYPDDTGWTTLRNMARLWKTCSGPFAPFRVARMLSYMERWRILWQSGVAGMPLSALGAGSPELLRLLKGVGRAIGALHRSTLECPGRVQAEGPCELLARAAVVRSRTEHISSCLVERLISAAPSLKASPRATVHRDLHTNNILSTDDGIALIDLDDLANGDPLEDLTRFLAHLCSWSLKRGLEVPRIEPMVSTVVRSYVGAVPWSVSPSGFRWHLAAALIYQEACRCITRPKARRLATLSNLVRLAEQVSNGGAQ